MTWLAIDPGPEQSAWVVYEAGKVIAKAKASNQVTWTMLNEIKVDAVAIEMVQSFGMAVGAEVFETVFWIGRFYERAFWRAIPVHRIFRKDVKMHLCQSMRAKDPNIRQALIDRLGAPGTKKNPGATFGVSGDCWSALAVAVTASDRITPESGRER